MDFNQLKRLVSSYVTELLNKKLDDNFYFHHAAHTQNVAMAVIEIGGKEGLSKEEIEIATIAAWFHDTGYTVKYQDHEDESIDIAKHFLKSIKMNKAFIDQVCSCILATRFPQRPKNKMEMVLCDADFYHLCRLDYIVFERMLRLEWEQKLKLVYTNQEWNTLNLEMLKTHYYFTNYGQLTLQPLKLKHIQRIERQLDA